MAFNVHLSPCKTSFTYTDRLPSKCSRSRGCLARVLIAETGPTGVKGTANGPMIDAERNKYSLLGEGHFRYRPNPKIQEGMYNGNT